MSHPIPLGFHALTPHLITNGASEAIEFYKRAFGATEISRLPMPGPDGQIKLAHAQIRIGDSNLFLADEAPSQGAFAPAPGSSSPVIVHIYVTDVDSTFATAVAAGATAVMPPMNMFWGDRYARLVDPFGHSWSIAEHLEDLTPNQMLARLAAAMPTRDCDQP